MLTPRSRSVRPSTILQLYLTLSLLFDIVRARALWLSSNDRLLITNFTTATASKALMLLFELIEKRRYLEPSHRSLPRKATSGFASVSIFWWLNRALGVGAGKIIGIEDLDELNTEFRSATLQESLQASWSTSKLPLKWFPDTSWLQIVDQSKPHALLIAIAKTFRWSLLVGVFPRLYVTGFTYVQPFLINTLINYLKSFDPVLLGNYGYGLIATYILVFFEVIINRRCIQIRKTNSFHPKSVQAITPMRF